ncbi:MAG TPA: esterase-like activity of phytase family protein [Vitreimonas sp.]|nr:esterase-like activity of phytase family protein [Vitreimonas sp.]
MRFLFFIAALAACAPSAAIPPSADQWREISVESVPVQFGDPHVDHLLFRGGVELRSADPSLGGLSGLEVLEDGRFVAEADTGEWFDGQLVLDARGNLTGVTNVRTAIMRDDRGQPCEHKDDCDAEDLAQLPDGRFAVSFEQTQTIRIYDLNRDGPFGVSVPGPRLDGVRHLPPNTGLEALSVTADGVLVVGAEGEGHRTTPIWLAPLDATGQVHSSARFPLSDDFSLTSLDRLPNGDFIALERFYAPVIGPRARIARFTAAAMQAGTHTIEGVEQLAALGPPHPVDNFEGISAVRMPNGVTRLYIVSDNNFSARQRTLLYAVDIVETPAN